MPPYRLAQCYLHIGATSSDWLLVMIVYCPKFHSLDNFMNIFIHILTILTTNQRNKKIKLMQLDGVGLQKSSK